VVSEETGQLSVAYKGVLKRGMNADEMGEYLRNVLLEDVKKKRFSLNLRGKGGAQ